MTANAPRSGCHLVEKGEIAKCIIILCDDGKMRVFNYNQLISSSGVDNSVVIEFVQGQVKLSGRGLEAVIRSLAEHQVRSLSASDQNQKGNHVLPQIESIRFSPLADSS